MSREVLTEHILLNLQTFPQFTGQFYVAMYLPLKSRCKYEQAYSGKSHECKTYFIRLYYKKKKNCYLFIKN